MNLQLRKIFILFSILIIFYSCKNDQEVFLSSKKYNDSIHYFNEKIKSTSNDSLKKGLIDLMCNINVKIKNDSIRIKNYDTIAYNYFKINDFENYKKTTKLNLDESLKSKDTIRIIKSYVNYGNFYLRRSMHDSAYYNYDKAQKLYVRLNQFEKTNELSLNKATIQYFKGDYLGCETTIFKSLTFLKKENNDLNLNVAYTLIGLSKIELNEYNDAIEYLTLAFDLTKKIDIDKASYGIALNNLGLVYFKKGDYIKAIEYYNKAIGDTNLKLNNFQVFTLANQNLTYSKFKLGDIKNFEENYQQVLENYKILNISQVQPKIQLSEFYETQNNIEKAKELALDAYNIAVKEKVYRDKLLAIKQLANVFPDKAKFYSTEYFKLSDSIAAVDKKIQNTFARIEYRVDELNDENLLLAQKNKITLYYALIVLLLVFMFFIYRWQKLKQNEYILIQEQQKANEEVYNMIINQQNEMDHVKENEQHRISRELHDGVLGKLFGVRMNLDILNNDPNASVEDRKKYINEIIQVEKIIRQISHELNDDTRSIINNYQLMIDQFVDEQKSISDIKINYTTQTKVPWDKFTAQEKINIYRIIQETFQNINKYSKAQNVDFLIKFVNNILEIVIEDDGVGFDTSKLTNGINFKGFFEIAKSSVTNTKDNSVNNSSDSKSNKSSDNYSENKKVTQGIGIKNMKERAKLINATYEIRSQVNKGTYTRIVLEINQIKQD